MPRKVVTPELKFHKPTGQHCVYWRGQRINMGARVEKARERYEKWKLELSVATKSPQQPPPAKAGVVPERTVIEVLVAYLRFAKVEYAHNRSTVSRIEQALEAVQAHAADWGVSQFRGRHLKEVRSKLVSERKHKKNGKPLSRTYVNYLVACVQRCWRWALSEDLVGHQEAESIRSVEPLAKGRGGREPARVLPPPAGWEEALVELAPVTAAMVRVQALCGMRPQDVCRMRRGELSTSPAEKVELPGTGRYLSAFELDGVPVWLYVPREHKTSWKGKPRVVVIGPQCRAILAPLLGGLAGEDYVFSPAKALAQIGRGNRFKREGYASRYETRQYAQLVERAVERANRPRVKAGWLPEELVPAWCPNQLRHLAATVVGDELDREHARAMLGQSSSDVIDTYMEQQIRKAARAAVRCG